MPFIDLQKNCRANRYEEIEMASSDTSAATEELTVGTPVAESSKFFGNRQLVDKVFWTLASSGTLRLIEVMKRYTTIEASADGVVESVLVEDGKLIAFDQPLFVIRNHDS